MDFSERIKELRNQAGITQDDIAEKLGISRTAVTMWESGKSRPRLDKLEQLAGILKTTPFYLLNGEQSPLPPNALPIEQSPLATLPYYGTVHAGDPIEPNGANELQQVPKAIADAHPNGFILDVIGDCMNNVYPDGCRIVVDPTLEPRSGDIGAFSIDGEVLMRRVLRGANTLILSPDSTNPEHHDIVVSEYSEVISYGRVVWYQAAKEM